MVLRPRMRVRRGSQSGARNRSSGSTRPIVSNRRSISLRETAGLAGDLAGKQRLGQDVEGEQRHVVGDVGRAAHPRSA